MLILLLIVILSAAAALVLQATNPFTPRSCQRCGARILREETLHRIPICWRCW